MISLPKNSKDFASQEYWDEFFKQSKESFDWYGDYKDIKPILSSYMKTDDNLLVIGCGNSTLSVELFDDGYCNNTSIDISNVVINKMITKYKNNKRQKLNFHCMDMLQMSFPDESFNIVIDKGTLDAVLSDDTDIDRIFSEISRVLKFFGRYICISLLQKHILIKLLSWFLATNNWLCRIERCFVKKDPQIKTDSVNFPVFMVTCLKMKNQLPAPYVEFSINKAREFKKFQNMKELTTLVRCTQKMEMIKYSVRSRYIPDNFYMELFDVETAALTSEAQKDEYRYKLYFAKKSNDFINIRCSVFIVPEGQENEWLFSSAKGREELLNHCYSDRMIVVVLNKNKKYGSIQQIKIELSNIVVDFFPPNCGNILFLSMEDDKDEKKVLWEGESDYNGKMLVEDVFTNTYKYRRLVFAENRHIIQSEARLKDNGEEINHEVLSCNHHEFVAASFATINKPYKELYSLLMVGLGGGCFINFLNNFISENLELKITVIEIDPMMLKVAEQYFEFKKRAPRKNVLIDVKIEDGLKYLENCEEKFDFIIFDVNSNDLSLGISCPPEAFIEMEFLKKVKNCLTNDGYFILNLVARNKDIKLVVYNRLVALFRHHFYYRIDDDLNEMIFLSNADQLEWFQINEKNDRYDYLVRSCFYISLLERKYKKLFEKFHPLTELIPRT